MTANEYPAGDDGEQGETSGPHDELRNRRRGPSRLRNIAIGMVLGLVLSLSAIAVAIVIFRGEMLPAITPEILAAAEGHWKTSGPANYDLDLVQTGVNPAAYHVEVRHGDVVAMTRDGHPTRENTWEYWSVPGLLSVIRRDLEVCMAPQPAGQQQPAIPRGTFEAKLGYPLAYHRVTPTGADAKWQILKFEAK
ncbi:MAG TPA: hypothetical protein VGJ15_05225 [Pirellulales bacterium]